jgi:hypothetical protein
MVDTPGRCRDLDYCSIGQMRTLVRVPLGEAFVCPECGKPLRAPIAVNAPLSRKRLVVWSVGTLGLFLLLYECMAPSGKKHRLDLAALQEQQQARIAAAARPVAAPAPVKPPAALPPPLPVTPLAPAPVKPPARSPLPVAAAPAPTPRAPVAQVVATPEPKPAPASPPPAAAKPTVSGPTVTGPTVSGPAAPSAAGNTVTPGARVTMECSIDAAGVPSNCAMVKDHEQPMPPHQPKPLPPPAPKPQPTPEPGIPGAPTESEASIVPVAGGMPSYPLDYVRDGRFGEVSVTCVIESTGEPQNCRVRDYIGGRRFAEAVVNWLNSGTVRFKPAVHEGIPVAQERHWHIVFPPR